MVTMTDDPDDAHHADVLMKMVQAQAMRMCTCDLLLALDSKYDGRLAARPCSGCRAKAMLMKMRLMLQALVLEPE